MADYTSRHLRALGDLSRGRREALWCLDDIVKGGIEYSNELLDL